MNTVYLIFQLLAAGFAIFTVSSELYRNRKNLPFIWTIWKRFRFGIFLQAFVLVVIVLVVCVFLSKTVPFLHYGWLHLILENGGNIITAPFLAASQSEYIGLRMITPIFLFCLLLAVPFLAEGEERIFRKGYHTWKNMIQRSVYFGLIHLVVGVPLSVAITLIIPGLFFAHKYQRAYKKLLPTMEKKEAVQEAVLVSTTYHTMMNSILITYLIVLTALCV